MSAAKQIEAERGQHLCCLYATEKERQAQLRNHIHTGLSEGARVIYFASPEMVETTRSFLDTEAAQADNEQLEFGTTREPFFRDGTFAGEALLDYLRDQTQAAADAGYPLLRVAGEMTWLLEGFSDAGAILDFEAELRAFLSDHACSAILQYDWRAVDPRLMLAVVQTHSTLIIGTEAFDNVCTVPPAVLRGTEAPRATLERWLTGVIDFNEDQAALKREAAIFRSLAEDCANIIARLDFDGVIRYQNVSAQELLGYDLEEWVGESLLEAVHPEDVDRVEQALQNAQEDPGTATTVEFRARHADGTWRSLEADITHGQHLQTNAAIDGLVLNARDITERRRWETGQAAARRHAALLRQGEWLQLAQDLHNGPIQGVFSAAFRLASLASLAQDEISAARIASVRATLQQVVDELRDLMDRLRPSALRDFGLEGAVQSLAAELQVRDPTIDIDLNFAASGDSLPIEVQMLLYRIVVEVLDNALQHAQATTASVQFDIAEDQLTLQVTDDGRGFEAPRRLMDLLDRGYGGLWQASQWADAIGGSLAVTSSPDDGTHIVVVAPIGSQQPEVDDAADQNN